MLLKQQGMHIICEDEAAPKSTVKPESGVMPCLTFVFPNLPNTLWGANCCDHSADKWSQSVLTPHCLTLAIPTMGRSATTPFKPCHFI